MAVGAALLLFAGVAAAGKVKTLSSTVEITTDPITHGRGFALAPKCKRKGAQVGSGFDVRPYDPAGIGPQVTPTSGGAGLVAGANTGGATGMLTAEAYCWSGIDPSRSPRGNTQLPPGDSGKAFKRCDRGFSIAQASYSQGLKGVADVDQSATIRSEMKVTGLYLKHRGGKQGGTVEADNNSAVNEFRLFVHLECYRKGPKLVRGRDSAEIAAGAVGTVTANCPRGSFVVSGGFKGTPGTYILASLRNGKRKWDAVAHREGPGPGMLKAFAYCVPR